jgi:hypothetical protein
MEIPKVKSNQFAVAKAQYSSGIIIKKDSSFFLDGENINEVYEVFNSFQEAKDFAIDEVRKNSEIECLILDYEGNHISTFDVNGERHSNLSK